MKRYTLLTICVVGMALLYANAAIAGGSFDALAAQVHATSMKKPQSTYSRQLRKSMNAAAVRHLERTCARKYPGVSGQTFTLLGTMRLDGVLKSPTPLPDNAFTACVAHKMASVTFPLPPGNEKGWPVALQFDAKSGKVLYMAGDRQTAFPIYRQTVQRSKPWMYAPVPEIPAGKHKSCSISVWLSVGTEGRVHGVDVANSSCSASVTKAVKDAASQWVYFDKAGAARSDSMDVRLSFNVGRSRIRVKL